MEEAGAVLGDGTAGVEEELQPHLAVRAAVGVAGGGAAEGGPELVGDQIDHRVGEIIAFGNILRSRRVANANADNEPDATVALPVLIEVTAKGRACRLDRRIVAAE